MDDRFDGESFACGRLAGEEFAGKVVRSFERTLLATDRLGFVFGLCRQTSGLDQGIFRRGLLIFPTTSLASHS